MRRVMLAVIVGVAGWLVVGVAAQAPETANKMYRVGGGVRDGASAFARVEYAQLKPLREGEVDFKHFHTYEEATAILRMWAARYPNLVELYSVGQSLEGREIWQITITNEKTGRAVDKPAFFIEGGRHAGENLGHRGDAVFREPRADELRQGPGHHEARRHEDAVREAAQQPGRRVAVPLHRRRRCDRPCVRMTATATASRTRIRARTLTVTAFVRQMRQFVGAGKGNAVVDERDPKGRLMRNVAQGQGDYLMLGAEGYDNDGDGRVNEDGIGGLDLHRNYPENWRPMTEDTGRGYTQGGAGAYPLSEPETKAVFDFLMRRTHISVVNSLDTTVPMILRGPSTSKSEESVFPEDLEYLKKFDQKGMEITGYPWAGTRISPTRTVAAAARRLPPTRRDRRSSATARTSGTSITARFWYGNEIWNGGRLREADANGDGTTDDVELLQWARQEPARQERLPAWTKTTHPTLGAVEVGGWNPKFWSQNPPPEMIETWARNEAMFNLYLAQQLPQVRIVSATSKPAGEGAFDVTLTVTNEGLLQRPWRWRSA